MRPRPTLYKPLGSLRFAPARLSTSLPPLSFQSLTNCLRFATLSELLSFQAITNCPICNSFVLITIRNAGGWGWSPHSAGVKVILELRHQPGRYDHTGSHANSFSRAS